MSAAWDEVKRLAADFQRAQLSSTVQRLSDRNCIEIVKKLIELKLVDVIFTNDGKEYLTPARLLKEIKDELIVHGGRINLVDLAQIIGVDYNHVEAKANELVQEESDVRLVLGQLINNDYLNSLAEEINEKLSQVGEITIGELTKIYNLPGDYLEHVVHERLGTIIQGQVDSNDSRTFFTQSYLAHHTARIRGILSALTRPVPASTLINQFKIPNRLFYNVAEDLVKQGRLAGTLSGGHSERAIFLPDIYAKSQNEWVDNFYKQNGYLEFDALNRLGIGDPQTYINKKFKDEPLCHLKTVSVGKNILSQIEATIEEAVNSGVWVDISPLLPTVFTVEDCEGIIHAVSKSLASSKQKARLHVYCDTVILSDDLIKSCYDLFDDIMTKKAQEDIIKNPHLFVGPQASKTNVSKKETARKEKEEQKDKKKSKKQTVGKSGGGTQGRETKMKAVKKKYHTSKEIEESGSDDESSSPPKDIRLDLPFLTTDEIEKHLESFEKLKDCPEELIPGIAAEMHWPLTKKYHEVAKTLYFSSVASSGGNRRKQHADCQEKFSTLLHHIIMFERGAKLLPGDTSAQLSKHLLKTLCSDLANMITNYFADENGLISTDIDSALTTEQRLKLINQLPEEIKQPLTKLHSSLNEKNSDEFQSSAFTALGPGVCDMVIKKLDKKKEKLILSNQRHSLSAQLTDANDPALCLHLAVLLIFQSHTSNMLHASGKFVPQIISFLQRQVPSETYQLLSSYQELVMKKLSGGTEDEDCVSALKEEMPKIKEAAVTYKKTSISETEKLES